MGGGQGHPPLRYLGAPRPFAQRLAPVFSGYEIVEVIFVERNEDQEIGHGVRVLFLFLATCFFIAVDFAHGFLKGLGAEDDEKEKLDRKIQKLISKRKAM